MGLISWLKSKLFHKKKEEVKQETKPVEEKKEETKVESNKELDSSFKNTKIDLSESKTEVSSNTQVSAKKETVIETPKTSSQIIFSKSSTIFGGNEEIQEQKKPKEEEKPVSTNVEHKETEAFQPKKEETKTKIEPKVEIKEEKTAEIQQSEKAKEQAQISTAPENTVVNKSPESSETKEQHENQNVFRSAEINDLLNKKEEKEVEVPSEPEKEKVQAKEVNLNSQENEIKSENSKDFSHSPVVEEIKPDVHEENLPQEKEEKPIKVSLEKKETNEETTQPSLADKETKIYNLGLAKSRESFGVRLNNIANKYKEANSDYFDELERCLIEADVGVKLTMNVLDETEKMAAVQHINDPKQINDLLVDNLFMNYAKAGSSFQTEIQFDQENPTILLVVGVNGTGKTTTIAKLAKHYKEEGKKVMVIAADTFRAGAVEQLSLWAKKVGVDCFDHGQGADPASVCYDGVKKAIAEKYDLVLVDTAGRLHTKDYLMAELGKIVRVIKKILPVAPQETWLVLDANTGQNGVMQAKVFKEVTSLTGVVITKMDGTSKGGIILAIRDQLGVPVRFIGLGEHEDDLREFDLDRYLYALLVGEDEQDN